MKKEKIGEGNFVYVLGFPMGKVGLKRIRAIVRSGCIARINDTLNNENKVFLLDTMIFPGNSGGPVFLKPEIASLEGTEPYSASALIGIINEYINYQEELFSKQTGELRHVFADNSGLATAYPVDYINETIRVHLKRDKDIISQQIEKEKAKM